MIILAQIDRRGVAARGRSARRRTARRRLADVLVWHLGLGGGDRTGRGDGILANHQPRIAALFEPLERRLADDAVAGPAAELRPDHELRPDPGDPVEVAAPATAVVARWWRIE